MPVINLAKKTNGKERTLRQATYPAWKKAVLKLDPKASFTGDEDIDSSFKKDEYDCEWNGTKGYVTYTDNGQMEK